jgi:hypothetical protein
MMWSGRNAAGGVRYTATSSAWSKILKRTTSSRSVRTSAWATVSAVFGFRGRDFLVTSAQANAGWPAGSPQQVHASELDGESLPGGTTRAGGGDEEREGGEGKGGGEGEGTGPGDKDVSTGRGADMTGVGGESEEAVFDDNEGATGVGARSNSRSRVEVHVVHIHGSSSSGLA